MKECRKWLDGQNWLGLKREEGDGGGRRRPRYLPPHLRKNKGGKHRGDGAEFSGSDSMLGAAESLPVSFFNEAEQIALKDESLQPPLPITLMNHRAPVNPSEEGSSAQQHPSQPEERASEQVDEDKAIVGLFGAGTGVDSSPDIGKSNVREAHGIEKNLLGGGGLDLVPDGSSPVDGEPEFPPGQDTDDEENRAITKEDLWRFKFDYYKEKFHINASPYVLILCTFSVLYCTVH